MGKKRDRRRVREDIRRKRARADELRREAEYRTMRAVQDGTDEEDPPPS